MPHLRGCRLQMACNAIRKIPGCEDRVQSLPKIELVHRLVIDVGAQRVCDLESRICCLGRLTEVFLLISDVVLSSGHDTGALNPFDGLSKHYTGQDRVRTKGA